MFRGWVDAIDPRHCCFAPVANDCPVRLRQPYGDLATALSAGPPRATLRAPAMAPPPSRPVATDLGLRLESWKAIAAHLSRDVMTAQRWHRRAGVPVHRHADPRQRGVFAFAAELDAWGNQVRLPDGEPGPSLAPPAAVSPAVEPPARPSRPAAVHLVPVVLLTMAAILSALAFRSGVSAKPHPSASRDVVLVAAFVNNSGDRALDSSLQFTLERELSTGSLPPPGSSPCA